MLCSIFVANPKTTLILIFLFTWYNAPNPAFWIGYIALVSGDNVHVAMKNRLASSFIDIDANIISIWMETLVNLLHDIFLYHIHCLFFVVC